MRVITDVIAQIIDKIPNSEFSQYKPMINKLMKLADDNPYIAPEMMAKYFHKTSNILNHYIGIPVTGWQEEIMNIFNGDFDQ